MQCFHECRCVTRHHATTASSSLRNGHHRQPRVERVEDEPVDLARVVGNERDREALCEGEHFSEDGPVVDRSALGGCHVRA